MDSLVYGLSFFANHKKHVTASDSGELFLETIVKPNSLPEIEEK